MLYRTPLSTPVFSLRREIDRLFDDAFGQGGRSGQTTWAPAVDVREDEKSLTFEFELPGLRPDQVEITADNGILTVRGQKQDQRSETEGRHHIVERTYGTFSRSFQLPQGMNDDNIEAEFDNGVLTVRVPKAALPQPRKIEIRAGSQAGRMQGEIRGGTQNKQVRDRQVASRSGGQAESQPRGEPARDEHSRTEQAASPAR